jgi:hypothetical protein
MGYLKQEPSTYKWVRLREENLEAKGVLMLRENDLGSLEGA